MNLMTRLAAALALTLAATGAHAANVLVVLSDENHLDLKYGKVLSTGFYLTELMQPVKLLLDACHEVTFATPQGRAPTVDASSVTPARPAPPRLLPRSTGWAACCAWTTRTPRRCCPCRCPRRRCSTTRCGRRRGTSCMCRTSPRPSSGR